MNNKNKIFYLKRLLILVIVLRFFLDFFGEWSTGNVLPSNFVNPFNKNWQNYIVPDDREIAKTAYYYIQTNSFLTDVSFDRPKFRKEKIWPSALRNRYNILYHVIGIKNYEYLRGPIQLNEQNNLPESYFSFISVVIFFLKWILFLVALLYLYKCAVLFLNQNAAVLFVISYILYPSNFYVFPLNGFDVLATMLTTIIICRFIMVTTQEKINSKQILILGLVSAFIFTLKFHSFAIILPVCLAAAGYGIIKKRKNLFIAFSLIILMQFVIFIPLLISTKNTIGHAVLSTQTGVNLFHGHNPVAKGSWFGAIWTKYPDSLNPLLENEKNNLSADEFTETETYKKMAIQWALTHPKEEVMLSIKKTAIYFWPHNFMNWNLNPITGIVHLSFILFTFLMVINFKKFDLKYWILIISAWSMVAFNILFFVEYRWRYFVEPEMLLATFILFEYYNHQLINRFKLENNLL